MDISIESRGMEMGNGACIVSVSLLSARRIRVSSGAPNRPRRPEHISGVMVEYWDDPKCAVAGQWINEVASFDLPEGETLVELTVWTAYVKEHPEPPGKVVGMAFTASSGRRVQFPSQMIPRSEATTYRRTPHEELVSVPITTNSIA